MNAAVRTAAAWATAALLSGAAWGGVIRQGPPHHCPEGERWIWEPRPVATGGPPGGGFWECRRHDRIPASYQDKEARMAHERERRRRVEAQAGRPGDAQAAREREEEP